jgi:hypothetical protein
MAVKKYSGGSWNNISQVRRYNGSAWVDCNFIRGYNGSAWVDVWTRAKTILSPGAWVAGGITGWDNYYEAGSVAVIEVTQVSGAYTRFTATSAYSGGFGEITVFAYPRPVVMTGFTKLTVVYGACNPYAGLTFINIGGTRYSLDSVSGQTVVYNISGNGNIGIEMGATSAQARYISIVSMTLS